MTISLTDGTTTVLLDPDLYWSDEFEWSVVDKAVSRSLTGALIVQQGVKAKGRPITLAPEDSSSAWTTRADLEQLLAWTNDPNVSLTLLLRGATRAVQFRHNEKALDARPVVHFNDTDPGDGYLVTLRLMEV